MSKPKYYLLSGGRQLGKTKMLQEDFEKRIAEAKEALLKKNQAYTRFTLIFPRYIYDAMTQTQRRDYFKTHPDCDIYFLESLYPLGQKCLKLTRSGGLKKVDGNKS